MGSSLTGSQLHAPRRKRKEDRWGPQCSSAVSCPPRPHDVILIASGKVGCGAATNRTGTDTHLDTQTTNAYKEADKGGSSVTSSPVHSSHSTKQLPSQSSWARPPNILKERKWVFWEKLSGGGEFTPSRLYLTPPPAKKKKNLLLLLPPMVIVNIHEP